MNSHTGHVTVDEDARWADTLVTAINVQQAGITVEGSTHRIICENSNDGRHENIGGALGTMIAGRAGMRCPFCDSAINVSAVDPSIVDRALGSPAIKAPDAHMILIAQSRLDEYETFAGRDESYFLGYNMARSLKMYIGTAKEQLTGRWKGPKVEGFPLSLLIDLFNLTEMSSPARTLVIDWLYHQRALNPRQHWLEAIELSEDGTLSLNEQRYSHACWRGKQETYFASAASGYEALQRGLNFVCQFQAQEDEVRATIGADTPPALFAPRELQQQVKALKAVAPMLARLNDLIAANSLESLALSLNKNAGLGLLPEPPKQIQTEE